MPRLTLTDQQKDAVRTQCDRLFIEAAPGTGKTTVAAERYGVLRFAGTPDRGRSVSAVSFTRSATGELHRRIRGRWGSSALTWPHRVMTIDTLICGVVEHLLRQGVIRWPGNHTSLVVLDDWRGHRGYRWLKPGDYRRVAMVDSSGIVTSTGRRITVAGPGFGSRKDFHCYLEAGRCTHEEVREVLTALLKTLGGREVIGELLRSSTAHVVVDEVFDANPLDLALVDLACAAGVACTLVGDPWQALYGFRGARPDRVPKLLENRTFETVQLSESFRFESPTMRHLSHALREGQSVTLDHGDGYDVVLAANWDELWQGPHNVLPISFGRTTNKTDAAAIVLLDHLVRSRFGHSAVFLPEALVVLDLEPITYRTQAATVLGSVVEVLAGPSEDAPAQALAALRLAMKDLGAPRRPRSGDDDAEQRQIGRLTALARRVRSRDPLVPGMTIHQAKGREWDRVGVRLTDTQIARLRTGLDRNDEEDRKLYVALTRARYEACAVA
jgi:DNA helicase-2/ATP-dependent DNA helicase PcrA